MGSSPIPGTEIKISDLVSGILILAMGLEARLRYFMSAAKKVSNWGTEPVRFESHPRHRRMKNRPECLFFFCHV